MDNEQNEKWLRICDERVATVHESRSIAIVDHYIKYDESVWEKK